MAAVKFAVLISMSRLSSPVRTSSMTGPPRKTNFLRRSSQGAQTGMTVASVRSASVATPAVVQARWQEGNEDALALLRVEVIGRAHAELQSLRHLVCRLLLEK